MGQSGISLVVKRGSIHSTPEVLYLTQPHFPWLGAFLMTPQDVPRFAGLKKILARHTPEQASKANEMLMLMITSNLASLIGEELSIRILCSVEANDAATVSKRRA